MTDTDKAETGEGEASRVTFGKSYIGCVIDGSCSSADYINLETIAFARSFGFDCDEEVSEDNEDYSQILSEMGDEAVSFLNDQELLPYCSFYFEDNSLFYAPSVENAREDVGFVSGQEPHDEEDSDYPPADYEGEWLHVSDHGNATLYLRDNGQDKEIWGVV